MGLIENSHGQIVCQVSGYYAPYDIFGCACDLKNYPLTNGTQIQIDYRLCRSSGGKPIDGNGGATFEVFIEEDGQKRQQFSLSNGSANYLNSYITLNKDYNSSTRLVYRITHPGYSGDTHTELSAIYINGQSIY